jgi:hypothetical protein
MQPTADGKMGTTPKAHTRGKTLVMLASAAMTLYFNGCMTEQ